MGINWEKLGFRRDRGTLIRAGIFFLASAVAVLFFYFNKEDIKGKDDLTFISGPFAEYSWIDHGGRNGLHKWIYYFKRHKKISMLLWRCSI
jgi:hypothetical protein